MAVIQESDPILEVIAADGKFIRTGDAIPKGERTLFLKPLLEGLNRFPQFPCTLPQIQAFLAHEIEARIPEELIFTLGFSDLSWRVIAAAGALPIVLMAAEKEADELVKLTDAKATLVIDRIVSNFDRRVVVQNLYLGGVMRDSQGRSRVAGLRFNRRGELFWADVSVSEEELPMGERGSRVLSFPTGESMYDITAGVITPAMVKAAGLAESHDAALLSAYDSSHTGGSLSLLIGDAPFPEDDTSGFSLTSSPKGHILEFAGIPDQKLSSWKITFPRRLAPVLAL